MRNKQALILLFLANGVAGFAQGITMLAIPVYFTSIGSSGFFTLFYAVITVLSLFWGLYAGAVVDGFNRKDVFLGTNFIAGLIVLCIASLGFKEQVLPEALILMIFTLTFFGYYIHYPNLYAFAQEITEPKDYTRVTSYIEIVGQTTTIAAAALAVVLFGGMNFTQDLPVIGQITIKFEPWHIYEIFLLDGFAYMASFLIIIFISYNPIKVVFDYDEAPLFERLKTGYDYLNNNRLISLFGICSFSILIVVLVQIFALLPVYVKHHLQEQDGVVAMTEFMYGSGSLFSGVIISKILKRMPIPKSIILLTFMTAFGFFLAAFTRSAYIYYVFALIIGFTNSGSRIFRVVYLLGLVPNEIMGRVNGMFNVYSTIVRCFFLVLFSFSFFNEGSNIVYAYMMLGSFTFVSGIVLIFIYQKVLKLTESPSPQQELEPVH